MSRLLQAAAGVMVVLLIGAGVVGPILRIADTEPCVPLGITVWAILAHLPASRNL